jgi:hypothetical protein
MYVTSNPAKLSLPERLVKYMLEESFESLVTSTVGRDIGKELFANIVKMKINDGAGVCTASFLMENID